MEVHSVEHRVPLTVVTAKVAGVDRIAAKTPPSKGTHPPVSIPAMHLAGADEIYVLGGIQAIAALTFGTETIEPVILLTDPGNAYVTEAKRQLFGEVGIDLFAGPTEVLIVADETAEPFVVATDLLSQAEHGPDSPAVLITTSDKIGLQIMEFVEQLLPDPPPGEIAGCIGRDFGEVHVVDDLTAAYALADETGVAFGDKVIGTNHVLPTLGAARYTGRLWGREIPQDRHLPRDPRPVQQRRARRDCSRASRLENFEGHARSADTAPPSSAPLRRLLPLLLSPHHARACRVTRQPPSERHRIRS
jgi:sulfopropanediol 3-dehydrogenase